MPKRMSLLQYIAIYGELPPEKKAELEKLTGENRVVEDLTEEEEKVRIASYYKDLPFKYSDCSDKLDYGLNNDIL
jgi:hypothetical protein